jgi:hypothetical protein
MEAVGYFVPLFRLRVLCIRLTLIISLLTVVILLL